MLKCKYRFSARLNVLKFSRARHYPEKDWIPLSLSENNHQDITERLKFDDVIVEFAKKKKT